MKGDIEMNSSLASDVREIIDRGVYSASASVNQIAAMTYWRVGRRIVEEIKRGENRAEYGARLIDELARALRPVYTETAIRRDGCAITGSSMRSCRILRFGPRAFQISRVCRPKKNCAGRLNARRKFPPPSMVCR